MSVIFWFSPAHTGGKPVNQRRDVTGTIRSPADVQFNSLNPRSTPKFDRSMYIPCRFHSSDATVLHAPPDSDPSFVAKRASSSFPTTNLLCGSVPPWRSSLSSLFSYSYELLFPQALCFENNPHCPGVCPPASLFQSFRLWVSVFLWQIDSFHTIADSLVSRKKSSALESRTSGLFCKNTRGGGGIHSRQNWFPDHVLHGVPKPRDVSVSLFAESRAVATFQFRNHYLREAALC